MPLLVVAAQYSFDSTFELLRRGADANVRLSLPDSGRYGNTINMTPLFMAKNVAIAALLVQYGADVNAEDAVCVCMCILWGLRWIA